MDSRVKPVKVGELVEVTQKELVGSACTDKDNGHWYCVTHGAHFVNQFEKDSHIRTGKHKLAWICHQHGIEAP